MNFFFFNSLTGKAFSWQGLAQFGVPLGALLINHGAALLDPGTVDLPSPGPAGTGRLWTDVVLRIQRCWEERTPLPVT